MRISLCCFLIGISTGLAPDTGCPADDPSQLLRLVPENTVYAVVVDDFRGAWNRYGETASETGGGEKLDDRFWHACGLEPGNFAVATVSAVLRAETREPSGPSGKLILASISDPEEAASILQAAGERLIAAGAKRSDVTVAGTRAVQYTLSTGPGDASPIVHLAVGNLVVCASRAALAERAVQAIATQQDSDGEPSVAPTILASRPPASEDDRLHVYWYSNAWAGIDDVKSMTEQERADLEYARHHGLDGIENSSGLLTWQDDGTIKSYAVVDAPRPFRSTLRLLQLTPAPSWKIPEWLPDDYSEFALLHGAIPEALEHVGTLFDELYADGIEGTYDDILADLQDEEYGLGVDLKQDLYRHLGPRVVLFRGPPPEDGSAEAGGLLIAFQAEQEAEIAATVEKLMVDDPEVVKRNVPDCKWPLWEVQGEGDTPNSGAIVARGYLMMAEDVALIHQALSADGAAAQGLSKTAGSFQQRIEWPAATSPCMLLAWGASRRRAANEPSVGDTQRELLGLILLGASETPELQDLAEAGFDAALSEVVPYLQRFPLMVGYADENGFQFYSETTSSDDR